MGNADVINAYERGETLIGGISFSQVKSEEEPSVVDKKGQANEGATSSPGN
jgi:hypothetical protein